MLRWVVVSVGGLIADDSEQGDRDRVLPVDARSARVPAAYAAARFPAVHDCS